MSKIYGDFSIRDHLFPFRTEKLSLIAQMVLGKTGRVCRRRPYGGLYPELEKPQFSKLRLFLYLIYV